MALRRPVTQVNQLATVRTERAMRIVLAPLDRFSALRAGINACLFLVAHGFLLIAHGCFFSLMAALSRSWLLFLAHGCSFSRSWLPRARQIGFMQAIKGFVQGIQCTVIHHDIVC